MQRAAQTAPPVSGLLGGCLEGGREATPATGACALRQGSPEFAGFGALGQDVSGFLSLILGKS